MAYSALSIRLFRQVSLDIVAPNGQDLIGPFIAQRFRLGDGASRPSSNDIGLYLCFTPNVGLDEEFINEAADLYGIDFYDMHALCKPGGIWMRELNFEPDQLVLPSIDARRQRKEISK
jgi:hypothetical protein